MRISSMNRLLVFVISWALLVLAQDNSYDDSNCHYAPIPDTFNSLSYLHEDNEFHIHQEFYANTSQLNKQIAFNLTSPEGSQFRVYIAPHLVDVDLWLYNATSMTTVARSSLDIGTEEVIQGRFPPGSYILRINYFGVWIGNYESTDCDTLVMEIAVVPYNTFSQRVLGAGCGAAEISPNITAAEDGSVSYHSDRDQPGVLFNVQSQPQARGVRFVTSWLFTLPPSTSTDTIWELSAHLGVDFLTGGDLGLVLFPYNATAPAPTDLRCFREHKCNVAEGSRMNHIALHQLLEPGQYVLWLYDQVSERANLTNNMCSPYTLALDIFPQEVRETPLTCGAPRLPSTLTGPDGLYDEPSGYLHYTENFLVDLTSRVTNIPFNISSYTFLRVRASPHRIDIDLKILQGATVVQYGYNGIGEEGVAVYLSPGAYTLVIQYFGILNQARMCETMELEIAMSAASWLAGGQISQMCNGAITRAPDMSDINSQIAQNGNYNLTQSITPYTFKFGSNFRRQLVYSANFTLTQTMTINAQLGKNFLLGDITMTISSLDNLRANPYTPVHDHNVDFIAEELVPGNYSFSIWTAQVPVDTLPNFPTCANYTLQVSIAPLSGALGDCWRYRKLPTTLNSVEYLDNGGITHFSDQFVMPLSQNQFSSREIIRFTVPVDSILRVWTEAHAIIDTDLYLYENVTHAIHSNTNDREEVIIWKLTAGVPYELDAIHYHFAGADPHQQLPLCYLFNFQLAISPLSTGEASCQNNLPAATTIPTHVAGSNDTFGLQQRYYYTQTATALRQVVPFSINGDFIYFRAKVEYDFVWSDLSLYLRTPNGSTFAVGVNGYNVNDLETILLGPGNYELVIYEPSVMTLARYRRCIHFDLTINYEVSQNVDAESASFTSCDIPKLPSTLNTVSELNLISGLKVHWQHPVLVDVVARQDRTVFTVTLPSVLNVFVPYHPVVDVDPVLQNSTGAIIQWNTGLVEESVSVVLPPGSYTFSTRYYGYRGTALPAARDCASYPMEFALTPTAILETPDRTRTCSDTPLEDRLTLGSQVHNRYNRVLARGWNASSTFVLTTPATFDLTVRYEFAYAGLSVSLRGIVQEGLTTPVARTYYPTYGFNAAVFHRVLQPGNYTLQLKDPFGGDPRLHCGQYSLDYIIDTTDVPADYCDDTLVLPTDLWTADGGSVPFGGPQDHTDGSIRLFGENFLLTEADGRDHFITFYVTVPSFLRFYSKAPAGNDIDFWVYNSVNRTAGSMVGYSTGTETTETKVIYLAPQAAPYLMDIYYFKVLADANDPCPTYYFELAMKPYATVQAELQCPTRLPVPAVPSPFYDLTNDVYEFNDDFIFTQSRIAANTNGNMFTYRITLQVHTNTTLFVAIGYDFLANDFRLRLLDTTGSTVAVGESSGVENRDEYFNFYNLLLAEVEPGTYYMDIRENVRSKFNFTEYCHKFSYFFIAFTNALPSVSEVLPPGGTNLNPFADLSITVVFSEAVRVPNNQTLLSWITANDVVYLYSTTAAEQHIAPGVASLDRASTTLSMIFRAGTLSLRNDYVLYLDTNKLKTASGDAFTPMNETYHFVMSNCDCNGHGRCPDNSVVCVCDAGYAGPNCDKCATGYHLVGTSCAQNVPCQANTCNGHGDCDASRGYPVCVCYPGYATQYDATGNPNFCSTCAAGYGDYPNCTNIPDEVERPNRCNAPILPVNLDSYAYLGFDGNVHLSGNYYIDLDTQTHNTYFTVKEESVIRIYTEPHWVDIDIWLYRLADDGVTINGYVDNGIAVGQEETIFNVISGTAGVGTHYLLRFRYYIWDREHTIDCESFNLDMAISPSAKVKELAAKPSNACPSGTSLPSPPAIGTSTNTYTYKPAQLFSLTGNATLARNRPNYFWSFPFVVSPPAGKTAVLRAELDYRFLTGDVTLLLETGTSNHCGYSGGFNEACVSGTNSHNKNALNEELGPGNYTLWIYEPEPQNVALTNCTQFNFMMEITYEDIETDIFFCDARSFPESLNVAGLMTANGTVHIQEDFLLEASDITFTLTQTSSVRVAGYTEDTVSFTIRRTRGGYQASSAYSHNPELMSSSLTAGSYVLSINRGASVGIRCPVINLELALAPNTVFSNSCPGRESLPQLTIRPPFNFTSGSASPSDPPLSYYAYTNNPVVKQYQFTLDAVSWIEVMIDSDFLTGGLKLELAYTVSNSSVSRTIYGRHSYNRNTLRQLLDPGVYALKITRPSTGSANTPSTFPPCAEFNFYMSLYPLSVLNSMRCVQEEGENLPVTFNNVRYLGPDNAFDYQATNFKVPAFGDYSFKSQTVTFQVAVPSVIRVYTEPHIVDIDVSLFAPPATSPVAHGGYNFNNEESFTYELQVNTTYALTLYFWKWNSNVPACSTFNMEVAIVPTPLAQVTPTTCPGEGSPSRFPDGPPPGLPANKYEYDSVAQQADLHIQQQAGVRQRSPAYNFTLSSAANFHAELGYFFVSGDLQISLTNVDEDIDYYGVNALNGNVLNIKELPAGHYTMYIYEVAPAPASIVGCSSFTYYIFIEDSGSDALLHNPHRLPSTLNTISYLKYGDSTHFQGNYRMFTEGDTEKITFTLAQESLVRVATGHNMNTLDEIQVEVWTSAGTPVSSFFENALEILSPGDYRIELVRPGLNVTGNVGRIIVEFQMAIAPLTSLAQSISSSRIPTQADCDTTGFEAILPTPRNSYNWFRDELHISQASMASLNAIQSVPFTLQVDSIFYAQVAYNFLLGDLELNITGTTTATRQTVSVSGRNAKNLNEIDEYLPAGQYVMTVLTPIPFQPTFMTRIPHCSIYSAKVIIQDADQKETHTDCSALDTLPWDLNNAYGGSAPYGGPINRGALRILGDYFLMPTVAGQVDTMVLNLTAPSIISLIAKEDNAGRVNFAVVSGAVGRRTASMPLIAMNDYNQRSELFVLSANTPTSYEIQLSYQAPTRVACPYFGFQLNVRPLEDVARSLICTSASPAVLPKASVKPNARGIYSEFTESYLASDVLTGNYTNQIEIDLTNTTGASRLIVGFGFASTSNMFRMRLYRRGFSANSLPYSIGNAVYEMSHAHTASTDVNLVLSGLLTADMYYLRITHPALTLPFNVTAGSAYCYPFIYQLEIVPDDSVPYVPDVEPPSASYLNPSDDLEIDIRFSTAIYDSVGNPVTSTNSGPFKNALSLQDTSDANAPAVHPTLAEGVEGMYWHAIFPASGFASKKSYKLVLDNTLFSEIPSDGPVVLVSTNIYRMIDTNCSGHGDLDRGVCFCARGYAGEECDGCDAGYRNTNKDPNGPLKCEVKVGNLCQLDSCGCKPNIQPCQPLGDCVESRGYVQCNCYGNYNGTTCQACKDGYTNWEAGCIRIGTQCPACVHGTCNDVTKKCDCDEGYSGPDCSIQDHFVVPSNPGDGSSAGLTAIKVISLISVLFMIVTTIAFMIYRRISKKRRPYMAMEGFSIDDESAAELTTLDED